MKNSILIILFFSILQTIDAQYIPPHREDVSQADYDKWVRRIKYYHEYLNDSEEKLQPKQAFTILANYSTAYYVLKEPTDSCYQFMERAMKIDKDFGCVFLDSNIETAAYLGIPSFKEIIGIENWEYLMQGCGKILAAKEEKKAIELANEYEINKNIYNFELIAQLTEIMEKDQASRIKSIKNKSKNHFEIDEVQDSLNLLAIEAIIAQYGYPGKSLVGSKCETYAMWIIHHAKYQLISV